MSLNPSPTVTETLKLASSETAAGRLDEAVRLYKSVLEGNPHNAEALEALHRLQKLMKQTKSKRVGKSDRKLGAKQKARPGKTGSDSQRKTAHATAGPEPHPYDVARLKALYDSGQLAEAEGEARRLIQEFPSAVVVINLLGTVLAGLGRTEEAIACYVQAITIKPDYAEAHSNLGTMLLQLGLLDKAAESYRLALMADPDFFQAHHNLGTVLRDLDRPDEALASYLQALRLRPDDADVHSNLGVAHQELGRLEVAVTHYRRSLELNPDNAPTNSNLGVALQGLGRFEESADCFQQALKINPDYTVALANFSDLVWVAGAAYPSPEFRETIIRCLLDPGIESAKVVMVGMKLLKSDLTDQLEVEFNDRDDLSALAATTNGLLAACLKTAVVKDSDIERTLTRARRALLETVDENASVDVAQPAEMELLEALAYQGFLNEYLWHITEEEAQAVDRLESKLVTATENGVAPSIADLYLLAAYQPLCAIGSIRQWICDSFDAADAATKPVLQQLVINPVREVEIRDNLEQLTSIEDGVSVAVRSQYEENPYPRWDSLTRFNPRPYIGRILRAIAPHRPALEATSSAPDVLIAGCGTGQHPISSALAYQHSKVLAVDLSRTSLAFAKRKAEELKVPNIRFAQADILKLGELTDRFDIIECGGVLHHMADPEAGLKVLVDLLKPGGFMKIGLYSELARQHIVQLREFVAQNEFEASLQGMREFRAWVRGSDTPEARKIEGSGDFYSASTIRDLIFHVQEHRFSVPRIRALLDGCELDFLGFYFADPNVKAKYSMRNPDDPDCIDFDSWHLFEQDNPRIFAGMYMFWCRKSAEAS